VGEMGGGLRYYWRCPNELSCAYRSYNFCKLFFIPLVVYYNPHGHICPLNSGGPKIIFVNTLI